MSEASSEVKSMDNDGSTRKLDRNSYYFSKRAPNPWPAPTTKLSGGAFGSTSGTSEQPKKFGGGFGCSTFEGFGGGGRSVNGGTEVFSNFDDFSSAKKESGFTSISRGGFGLSTGYTSRSTTPRFPTLNFVNVSKERCVTPSPSEGTTTAARPFTSSPRSSEVMSPSKRSRTGRRSGRRGRGGPGHCFHCQEHGHISRLCPKKAADTDEFEGGGTSEVNRFIADEPVVTGTPRTHVSLTGRDYQSAKLENQKARESYYGGYGYGKTMNTSASTTTAIKSRTPGLESEKSGGFGGLITSPPEVDKFSEQLDNALNLHLSNNDSPIPSPRGLSQVGKESPGSRISSNNKPETAPIKTNSVPFKDKGSEISSDTLSIETRRSVTREGECRFEEVTVIYFPRDLPENVRVITAQFVPVSSTQ